MKPMIATVIIGTLLVVLFIALDSKGESFTPKIDTGTCFVSCVEVYSQKYIIQTQTNALRMCNREKIRLLRENDSLKIVIRGKKKKR